MAENTKGAVSVTQRLFIGISDEGNFRGYLRIVA